MGGRCPPLVPNKTKSPADIAYDCWATSGPTTTIALAAGKSSLQVSMTVISDFSTNAMSTTVELNG